MKNKPNKQINKQTSIKKHKYTKADDDKSGADTDKSVLEMEVYARRMS